MKKDLLDLLKNIEDKSGQLCKVFGIEDYYDDVIDILWNLIADEYEVNLKWRESDELGDVLYEYGEGKLTKKQAIKKLKKLK